MRLARILWIVVPLVVLGGAAYTYAKLKNPGLPAPERVTELVHLDQGWADWDRQWFRYTPQGTLLMPLAWLKASEQGFFSDKPLIDQETLAGLRFLTDFIQKDELNPQALPVGWTVGSWASPDGTSPAQAKVGFTCATCHTGQLNYKGTAIQIDGAGALMNAGAYQEMVGKSILATWILPWKRARFLDSVTASTHQPREEVEAGLRRAAGKAWTALRTSFPTPLYAEEGYGRLDALQRIANTLLADDTEDVSNNRPGLAPVKFPYLWDIWRLDWVQYNASVRQPMARNAGEALGVRAETNFVHDHVTQPESERWRTSVQFANIAEMETSLHRLHAPVWPANVLGPIDKARAEHGRALFEDHCAACHGIKVVSQATPIEWKVTPIPLKEIGTDPGEAIAFKENRYSGKALGIDREIDGAEALRTVTEKVKDYFYDQENYTKAQREDADGLGRKNEVVANLVYKARPLIGIWASPPYLHNGSVPTIYDLLSPERPAAFYKGTREYDPEKLGFRTEPFPNAEEFDSKAKGNSNHGHWFANDSRPGKLGDEFSIEERYALIEYLKSASYADYPCNDAVSGAPLSGAVCGAE